MTPPLKRLDVRFSLRAVFVVFFCLSIGCALLFSTPDSTAVPLLVFLTVALPATLTAGAVYTRGNWRAFCIGGLFPSGLALYTTGWMFGLSLFEGPGRTGGIFKWPAFFEEVSTQYRVYAASTWVMTVLIGAIVVVVRYFARKDAEGA